MKLVNLAATRISDEEGAVELNKGILDLSLALLVNILLVEGNDGLGDGLSDSCEPIQSHHSHHERRGSP